MKINLLIFLLLISLSINAQNDNRILINFIESADSVMLVSHEDLNLKLDIPGKDEYVKRNLIDDFKINYYLIKEKSILNSEEKGKLIDIISNQNPDSEDFGKYCFYPYHAILLFQVNRWYYIDLSFGCKKYGSSKELKLDKKTFLASKEDWNVMQEFFLELNFKYNLPEVKRK